MFEGRGFTWKYLESLRGGAGSVNGRVSDLKLDAQLESHVLDVLNFDLVRTLRNKRRVYFSNSGFIGEMLRLPH